MPKRQCFFTLLPILSTGILIFVPFPRRLKQQGRFVLPEKTVVFSRAVKQETEVRKSVQVAENEILREKCCIFD